MRPILAAGVILGVLTGGWTFVMGVTGWYKHPTLLNLFWVVIPIEIAVIAWGLRETRKQGRRYWGQVGAGALMAAVAAPLIFLSSILFTTVVYPGYFGELRAMHEQMLRDQKLPEDEIKARVDQAAAGQTSLGNAAAGAIGTIVTGLVTALIAAAFVRSKDEERAPAG
jgi:hypothetical protein